jgi:hypothetical protein
MEKFDPSNPKYKRIEDLPREETPNFREVKRGFVRKEAIDAYEEWERKLKENPKFEHVFSIPKKAVLALAQEEARKLEEGEDESWLENRLKSGFETIFRYGGKKIADCIDNHTFDSVISEDNSARVPAEIMQRAINKIYRENKQSEIPIIPFKPGRGIYGAGNAEPNLEKALKEGTLGDGILYVTETIAEGDTVDEMSEIFDAVFKRNPELKIPKFYGFLNLGEAPFVDHNREYNNRRPTKIRSTFEKYGEIVVIAKGDVNSAGIDLRKY